MDEEAGEQLKNTDVSRVDRGSDPIIVVGVLV